MVIKTELEGIPTLKRLRGGGTTSKTERRLPVVQKRKQKADFFVSQVKKVFQGGRRFCHIPLEAE